MARLHLTIAECAAEMGCTKQGALDRLRRLEDRTGIPVLFKELYRGKWCYRVRRTDLDRAARACGLERRDPTLSEIYERLESLDCSHRQVIQLLKIIADKLGARQAASS